MQYGLPKPQRIQELESQMAEDLQLNYYAKSSSKWRISVHIREIPALRDDELLLCSKQSSRCNSLLLALLLLTADAPRGSAEERREWPDLATRWHHRQGIIAFCQH